MAIPDIAGYEHVEGPDASKSRRVVIGIMHEGTPEVVILHASLKSSQRHSTGRG